MGKEKRKKPSSSPSKEGGVAGDIMFMIGELTETFIDSVNSDLKDVKAAADWTKLKEVVVKNMRGSLAFHKKMADQVSDLCKKVSDLEALLERAGEREVKNCERLEAMERIRESVSIKASRAEMAAKMEHAVTQVKLLDLSLDTQTDDRKVLLHAVTHRLKAKVMAADQPRYDELMRKAQLQVLANKSTKRKRREDGVEIWTAPVVLEIKDRETRWEMEDLLRRSRIFPTFHWPKEFLDPMRKMREELKKKVDEETHYVRIRPVQSEGKWRIRADVRPKEGNARFSTMATWEMPPLDAAIREKLPDWFKPNWAEPPQAQGWGPPPPPCQPGGGWVGGE